MTSNGELLYLGGFGEGVTAARRDGRTGDLTGYGVMAEAPSPSFLAHHPRLPVLYAACRSGGEGQVRAWRVAGDGRLRPLATDATTGGDPCHVAVDPSGGYVLCANYGGGSVAVHRLDPAGTPGERTDLVVHRGSGPHRSRQEQPHAHMVSVTTGGVDVVDLGADTVFHYRLALDTGRLEPTGATRTPPGTGPRHAARHGDRRYLVGELAGTLICNQVDPAGGRWRELESVPICADGAEGFASEVAASQDGRFVYAATRGPDRIAVFATDAGALRRVTEVSSGGHWPRHFALVGEHLYVANERSHTVVAFRVDPHTGVPTPTGNQLDVASPSCVLPFPDYVEV